MNSIWHVGFILMLNIGCVVSAAEGMGGDTPEADDISATERVAWFEEARFGMFIHWGLYSELAGCWDGKWMPQPGHGKSWYASWIQTRLDVPDKEYRALVKSFNPVKFDADAWASEAAGAGMRYLVLTAKHHDGFALWDSAVTDYDLGSTPCKRDLLGELAEACRRHGIKLGFYYSHWQDWRHPGGAQPPWPEKKQPTDDEFAIYWRTICLPQVAELIDRYDPDMFWFDTWGKRAVEHITTQRRDQLIRLVRTKSPRCLINGRVCAHNPGDNVDYLSAGDNHFPEKNLGRPWQTPATMQHSWAWHARDFNWKSSGKMIGLLVHNTSLGGNYLLNVGPLPDGRFPAPAVRRLREIGGWMAANHEAIYDTAPVNLPQPAWGRLTQRIRKDGSRLLYANVFDWPEEQRLLIKDLSENIASATVLETGQSLVVKTDKDGAQSIELPEQAPDGRVTVIVLEVEGKSSTPGKAGNKLLLDEDFSSGFDNWWVEGGEKVWLENGRLHVKADPAQGQPGATATVWLHKPLPDNLEVQLDAHVVESSINANNINIFFNYSYPTARTMHDTRDQRADAAYSKYHRLNGYIITFLNDSRAEGGRHPDGVTKARLRLRRCPGFQLVDETFGYHCQKGCTYHVTITKLGGRLTCAVDGKEQLKWIDPEPLEGGMLGLRTFRTHLWWDNIKVKELSP